MNPLAIFDAMIFLRAAANPHGEARRCLRAIEYGRCRLVVSQASRYEVIDVLNRTEVRRKLPSLTNDCADEIVAFIDSFAVQVRHVPLIFNYPRDPKDEKYLNLAITVNAKYLVTRDSDLLDLMKPDDPEGIAFRTAYPAIEILELAAFLQTLSIV